jgi:hypothetical protein
VQSVRLSCGPGLLKDAGQYVQKNPPFQWQGSDMAMIRAGRPPSTGTTAPHDHQPGTNLPCHKNQAGTRDKTDTPDRNGTRNQNNTPDYHRTRDNHRHHHWSGPELPCLAGVRVSCSGCPRNRLRAVDRIGISGGDPCQQPVREVSSRCQCNEPQTSNGQSQPYLSGLKYRSTAPQKSFSMFEQQDFPGNPAVRPALPYEPATSGTRPAPPLNYLQGYGATCRRDSIWPLNRLEFSCAPAGNALHGKSRYRVPGQASDPIYLPVYGFPDTVRTPYLNPLVSGRNVHEGVNSGRVEERHPDQGGPVSHRRGRQVEYLARDLLRSHGYSAVRVSGSPLPIDLVAWKPAGVLLIGVTRTRKPVRDARTAVAQCSSLVSCLREVVPPRGGSVHLWLFSGRVGWRFYSVHKNGLMEVPQDAWS